MNFIESKKGFPFVLNRSLFLKKFKGKEEKIYVYNTQRRKLSHHVPQKIIWKEKGKERGEESNREERKEKEMLQY